MTTSTQGEIRPTAFDSFADATLAAIACNKAQAAVGSLAAPRCALCQHHHQTGRSRRPLA